MIFHLPNDNSKRPIKVMAHNIRVSTDKNFIRKLKRALWERKDLGRLIVILVLQRCIYASVNISGQGYTHQ